LNTSSFAGVVGFGAGLVIAGFGFGDIAIFGAQPPIVALTFYQIPIQEWAVFDDIMPMVPYFLYFIPNPFKKFLVF
jgi:hypothetical protein